jgi:hypothetical protein
MGLTAIYFAEKYSHYPFEHQSKYIYEEYAANTPELPRRNVKIIVSSTLEDLDE